MIYWYKEEQEMIENNALKKVKAGRFVKNNGRVLRTINMLRYRFVKLTDAKYALDDMPENEYIDSVNYLSEVDYIQCRHIASRQDAKLADNELDDLEAKLTDKGIRLLSGKIIDELVDT